MESVILADAWTLEVQGQHAVTALYHVDAKTLEEVRIAGNCLSYWLALDEREMLLSIANDSTFEAIVHNHAARLTLNHFQVDVQMSVGVGHNFL